MLVTRRKLGRYETCAMREWCGDTRVLLELDLGLA